jgi:hypothetical protein
MNWAFLVGVCQRGVDFAKIAISPFNICPPFSMNQSKDIYRNMNIWPFLEFFLAKIISKH